MSSTASEIHLVYVTTSGKAEALSLAQAAVQQGLAACANVLPEVTSVYVWEEQLREDAECVLVLKTQASRVQELTERLIALHSYDCPCVVSWPLTQGNPEFFSWVKTQTQGS